MYLHTALSSACTITLWRFIKWKQKSEKETQRETLTLYKFSIYHLPLAFSLCSCRRKITHHTFFLLWWYMSSTYENEKNENSWYINVYYHINETFLLTHSFFFPSKAINDVRPPARAIFLYHSCHHNFSSLLRLLFFLNFIYFFLILRRRMCVILSLSGDTYNTWRVRKKVW
jgi:hypothetical protein